MLSQVPSRLAAPDELANMRPNPNHSCASRRSTFLSIPKLNPLWFQSNAQSHTRRGAEVAYESLS
jgi:hypothetical protein